MTTGLVFPQPRRPHAEHETLRYGLASAMFIATETSQDRGYLMDYGVHLPLIGFSERPPSLRRLVEYSETAEELGFAALSANDHLLFSRPWLDGPTALSAVLSATGRMDLMTTVALPVIRGPVALAKSMAAIDILSCGRLIVGVGPGSSTKDYAAAGIPFEERFKRLDESVETLRALWRQNGRPFRGDFYSTEGVDLEPRPSRQGPAIWMGSWGSEAGLRRTARLGDGWLASAYNTTPRQFADASTRLGKHLEAAGKDPDDFPNAIATMFLQVTEDFAEADRICQNILAPTLNRPARELRERLLIGPPEECAQKLAAYQSAGAQRIMLWPVMDEISQLESFHKNVLPLTQTCSPPAPHNNPAS
jgi:alkanesulfonate monooxygenase SsuD/methylene tetrahydromethanopterin reductase-like flavin-dependent oxidoreductase (luciferase family)